MKEVLRKKTASIKSFGLSASVEPFDPITGNMGWNSGDIPSGTPLRLVYAFTFDGELVIDVVEGVYVVWGSVVDISAPSPGTSQSHSIKSYAWGVDEQRTFDAFCFIAEGPLDRLVADWNAGNRVVALRYDQFLALIVWASEFFQGVLTVHPEMSGTALISVVTHCDIEEGRIINPVVMDETEGKYYTEFPVEIPIGHTVKASAIEFRNDSDVNIYVEMSSWWEDPDGLTVAKVAEITTIYAGSFAILYGDSFILNKGGNWILHARMKLA